MNPQNETQQLRELVTKLQAQIDDLSGAFYKNNFSSSQTFTKDITFSSRLRVPVFDSTPAVGEVGDIFALSDGNLYVCIDNTPTYALVGTQS